MRFLASVAVLSLALATSVSAQTPSGAPEQPAAQTPPAQSAPATTQVADKKKDGVVCRRETPTGSMFPVKVCTTAEQRKAESMAARKAQDSMQGSASSTIPN